MSAGVVVGACFVTVYALIVVGGYLQDDDGPTWRRVARGLLAAALAPPVLVLCLVTMAAIWIGAYAFAPKDAARWLQ